MPAVNPTSGWSFPARPLPLEEAAKVENEGIAGRLLDALSDARPQQDGFDPFKGMPSGADIELRRCLFTASLVGSSVWPKGSESKFEQHGGDLRHLATQHEDANQAAKLTSDRVFSDDWTSGDGAAAAGEHYEREWQGQAALTLALRALGDIYCAAADNIRTAKRKIRAAHDEAHKEIEEQLRDNAGRVVNFGPILSHYRSMIDSYADELRVYAAQDTQRFLKDAGFAPLDNPVFKLAGNGSDGRGFDHTATTSDDKSSAPQGGQGLGRGIAPSPLGGDTDRGISLAPGDDGRRISPSPPVVVSEARGAVRTQAAGVPSLPSLGGGGTPGLSGGGLNSLSGMFGQGLPAPPAASLPASGVQGQTAQAMSAAVGEQFGRGLSAGSGIASAAGVGQAVPEAPSGPLAAPAGLSAPSAAVPAAAVTPPSAPRVATGTPAVAGGAASGAPLTPFGSVLPPAPAPAAAAPAAGAGSMPPPSVSGPAATAAATPSAASGFVPVRENTAARPSRGVSFSDLELARAVVADLVAASSVVHPGLQWAVGVGRGPSGLPDLWITTNEGAGHIPAGVFIPRTMPLAAGFDPEFDARWFGWNSPAETVWRALSAQGLTVSAVATSWVAESEDLRAAGPDVAFGVPPVGGPADANASRFTRGRSHRLETVAPSLYHEMSRTQSAAVDAYCREVTAQAAFHAGPELSPTAQAVARELVSGRWPAGELWTALRSEFNFAQMMTGAQRPGLVGVEDREQTLRYHGEFSVCRRMETLLAWDSGKPADVVYAARAAGVMLPFPDGAYATAG